MNLKAFKVRAEEIRYLIPGDDTADSRTMSLLGHKLCLLWFQQGEAQIIPRPSGCPCLKPWTPFAADDPEVCFH
jgi:hypothetical protein